MLNPEIKEKWITALESGEYPQTRSCLNDKNGFCCLGVLTDLFIKETGRGKWQCAPGATIGECPNAVVTKRDDEEEISVLSIPDAVLEWAFGDANPMKEFRHFANLVRMNDGYVMWVGAERTEHPSQTFTDIAQYIKENL